MRIAFVVVFDIPERSERPTLEQMAHAREVLVKVVRDNTEAGVGVDVLVHELRPAEMASVS